MKWALFSFLLICSVLSVRGQELQYINIPLIVNIQEKPDGKPVATEKEIDAYLKKVNQIFKPAKIKFTKKKVNDATKPASPTNDPIPPTWGNSDKNSRMTKTERETAEWLAKIFELQDGKGVKVYFAETVNDATAPADWTPGLAKHGDPVIFVRPVDEPLVKPPPGKKPTKEEMTGTAMAHELAHMLTLSGGHVIDGTTVADPAGHAPATSPQMADNLMFPHPIPGFKSTDSTRHGALTQPQIDSMRRHAPQFGETESRPSTATSPPSAREDESGGSGDQAGDQAGVPWTDIDWIGTYDTDGSGFTCKILTSSPAPSLADLEFFLLVDLDNNTGTGQTIHGVAGIETEVYVHVMPGPVLNASVTQHPGGTPMPLATVKWITEDLFIYYPDTAYPAKQQLEIKLDPIYLPYLGPEAIVTLLSFETGGPVSDEVSCVYYREWHTLQPALTLSAYASFAHDKVDFSVGGLEPNTKATVYVDDDAVKHNVTVDGSGSAYGTFNVPAWNDTFVTVTVQDELGNYGWTVLNELTLDDLADHLCGPHNDKVYVCHNGHTICISPNAVGAHLAQHADDELGECDSTVAMMISGSSSLMLSTFPNPTAGSTTISFGSMDDGHTTVELLDGTGRVTDLVYQGPVLSGQVYQRSVSFKRQGLYLVRMQMGNRMEMMKLIVID